MTILTYLRELLFPWTKPQPALRYVILRRGNETYMFTFTPETSREAINTAARWAADPELSFDWEDADEAYDQINDSVESEH